MDHTDPVDRRRLISACGAGSTPRWSTTIKLQLNRYKGQDGTVLPGFSDKESDPGSTPGCPTARSSFSGRTPVRQAGTGGFDSLAPHLRSTRSKSCPDGGIGIRAGLRNQALSGMRVQVPLWTPIASNCPDGGTGRRGGLKHRDSFTGKLRVRLPLRIPLNFHDLRLICPDGGMGIRGGLKNRALWV